jgi:hypothetical protein
MTNAAYHFKAPPGYYIGMAANGEIKNINTVVKNTGTLVKRQ